MGGGQEKGSLDLKFAAHNSHSHNQKITISIYLTALLYSWCNSNLFLQSLCLSQIIWLFCLWRLLLTEGTDRGLKDSQLDNTEMPGLLFAPRNGRNGTTLSVSWFHHSISSRGKALRGSRWPWSQLSLAHESHSLGWNASPDIHQLCNFE